MATDTYYYTKLFVRQTVFNHYTQGVTAYKQFNIIAGFYILIPYA